MADTVIYQKRNDEKVKIFDSKEYAKIGGTYPDLTAGNAEQLLSDDYVADTAPYTFRTAGGNVDIGDREYDELVGGTIAWNQFIKNGNFSGTSDWIVNPPAVASLTFTAADNVATLTTSANDSTQVCRVRQLLSAYFVLGHKYFYTLDVWTDTIPSGTLTSTNSIAQIVFGNLNANRHVLPSVANTWVTATGIIESEGQAVDMWVRMYNHIAGSTNKYRNFWAVDLTAAFGTVIADYIYSLETATPGAGVAWFKTHFPKDYYAYDPGSLQSVQAASHDMVGFNQFDKSTATVGSYINSIGNTTTSPNSFHSDYIPVFPNTTYYTNAKAVGRHYTVVLYDINKTFIKSLTTTTSTTFGTENAHFVIVQGITAQTSIDDLVVNLSWSGYRNGEYEAYEKHSYPLDSTLTLRGIPKLDASNNLVYDGDTYEADGTVTRRYGIVDLGTQNWTRFGTQNSHWRFGTSLADIKIAPTAATIANIVCSKYPAGSPNTTYTGVTSISNNTNATLFVCDESYSDAGTFKTAMSGIYAVYELNTPTTETADAFQSPQIVSDFGTEQYVDAAVAAGTRDVAIPVGHDTRYTQNLRDKLRRLPNMPDAEGDYLVRYTDRMSSLVPLLEAIPAAASDNTPEDLGEASAGTSGYYSRADHVHQLPSQIATNTANIEAVTVKADKATKNIANVMALMNGTLYQNETDSTSAYVKSVPSGAMPYATLDEIGGKTIVWTQYCDYSAFVVEGGSYTVSNNVITYTPTTLGNTNYSNGLRIQDNLITDNHKYFLTCDFYVPIACSCNIYIGGEYNLIDVPANTWTKKTLISQKPSWGQTNRVAAFCNLSADAGYTTSSTIQFRNFNVIDLTLLYGAGNEPTTVEQFRADFPADYYAYDAGTLISAVVTEAVSRGRNILPPVKTPETKNLATGITVVANADGSFTLSGTSTLAQRSVWFELEKEITMPDNSYLHVRNTGTNAQLAIVLYSEPNVTSLSYSFSATNRIGTTAYGKKAKYVGFYCNQANQTINATVTPSIEMASTATAFVPWFESTLPIPAAVQSLPGYGWSAGDVCNEVDFERKVYIQRVASVDLGTQNWSKSTSGLFQTFISGIRQKSDKDHPSGFMISAMYIEIASADITGPDGTNPSPDKVMALANYNTLMYFNNLSYSDAATFRSAMSGVYLYYELATPIETDISSLLSDDNLIAVEPGGTVSFPNQLGDDYRLPVPSDVEYTIDMAPDTPSTDGTYTLQCTVSSGIPTYSWISA